MFNINSNKKFEIKYYNLEKRALKVIELEIV